MFEMSLVTALDNGFVKVDGVDYDLAFESDYRTATLVMLNKVLEKLEQLRLK